MSIIPFLTSELLRKGIMAAISYAKWSEISEISVRDSEKPVRVLPSTLTIAVFSFLEPKQK
jgi:hypothetical protein